MAGRIRSIKPEILEDEKTAGLSHEAWRLFVSMWILADDHGALRGDAAWLDGQVFWSTPTSGGRQGVEECLEELAAVALVMMYEVRGQRYIQISGWAKHQKVDHPGKPRVPRPDDHGAWSLPVRHPDRVYFIRAEKSRAVKIGVSWNPARRLASLQAGHHERLKLEASASGDVATERALHARFASSRLSGEWFSDSPELTDFIESVATSGTLGEESRETIREPSKMPATTLAPDLRPPTSDHRSGDAFAASPLQLQPDPVEPKKAARAPRKKASVQMPDGWQPRAHERSKAAQLGLNCDQEAERFRDHHASRASTFADWDAAFRTWLGNALRFRGGNAAGQSSTPVRVAPRADDDYSRIPGMDAP